MANLSLGILGLPNVGKSTLFRALTSVEVPAENYPFCTIDPNVGIVEVPDPRLDRLHAAVNGGRRRVPAVVEFVDVAGLVEGASRGEGLGNRFLHHLREASGLVHVVRAFEDPSVVRAGGAGTGSGGEDGEERATPWRDREVVETELALADLETVAARKEAVAKKARAGDPEAGELLDLLRRVEARLERGEPARAEPLGAAERRRLRSLGLLTLKPVLYVLNVDEGALGSEPSALPAFRARLAETDPEAPCVALCARLEAELAGLPEEERPTYLEALGLEETGLDRLVREGYRLLGLLTFFTIGEEEVRAWTVPAGATAPEAAGRVHTDFQRGFVRAEVIDVDTFLEAGSMREARERGLVRSEGKEYVVRDGDILYFRAAP